MALEYELRDAVRFRNLAFVPIRLTMQAEGEAYLTLQEGLEKKAVKITERGGGDDASVPELEISNTGDRPVLLLAGDVVQGGKQDRVIQRDLVLKPGSGPVPLNVFCVEAGRWTAADRSIPFRLSPRAPLSVQWAANIDGDQQDVWTNVAMGNSAILSNSNNEMIVLGGNESLNTSLEDPKVAEMVKTYREGIAKAAPAGAPAENGFAVVINGDVRSVELFADSKLFARLKDRLVEGFIYDAIQAGGEKTAVPAETSIRDFIAKGRELAAAAAAEDGVKTYAEDDIGGTALMRPSGTELHFKVMKK